MKNYTLTYDFTKDGRQTVFQTQITPTKADYVAFIIDTYLNDGLNAVERVNVERMLRHLNLTKMAIAAIDNEGSLEHEDFTDFLERRFQGLAEERFRAADKGEGRK